MADAFVQLPDDSTNTGKKVRTQTRVVGIDTVHEHMFNLVDPIPAGDNNIGNVDIVTLPSLPAGTNNIGDVDVISSVLPTGASTAANQSTEISHLANISSDTASIGSLLSTGGTGLGKAEDAAHLSADVGIMALAVRKTTPANLSGTDGDYEPLQVSTGRLWVSAVITDPLPVSFPTQAGQQNIYDIVDYWGSFHSSQFGEVQANPTANTMLARLKDLLTGIVLAAGTNNIGDVDVLSLPSLPAGTNNIGDVDVLSLPSLPAGSNNIGDVDVLSVIPGTGATNLGKAEDAAHTSGDVGVMALGVRVDQALPGQFAQSNVEYSPFAVDSGGAVYTNDSFRERTDIFTAAGAGTTISSTFRPVKYFSLQVIGTGAAPTAWDVVLEGSLDGTNFTMIVQHTTATGNAVTIFPTTLGARPVMYLRSRVVSLTLGSATNISVRIIGMN